MGSFPPAVRENLSQKFVQPNIVYIKKPFDTKVFLCNVLECLIKFKEDDHSYLLTFSRQQIYSARIDRRQGNNAEEISVHVYSTSAEHAFE